ncbi:uncharacterized protein LOC142167180 [Nicotiana tabacum]|uniref:Uncharacterized protein LOC142167180 n=1 Tax=Nicotiana tabacum TaxID=4097 RepID=A0AC58SEN4_TOBAC
MNKLHAEIVNDLKQMLDGNNILAKTFRMVRDRFQKDRSYNVRLRLIGKRSTDGRRYNLPTVSEVAALVVGDFELSRYGYREDIPLDRDDESTGGRKCFSMREYFAYKIQERKNEVLTIASSKRLFQQFLIDAYTMSESSRLRKYSPCMRNERCTKYFSKRFVVSITIDEEGYPVYSRRDNGRTIKKSRSIKYLFKYINKGNDPVTAAFSQSVQEEDSSNIYEINMCYDAWRIFKFPIHHREPLVERLSFHLLNEQNVIFSDDGVTNRPSFVWKKQLKRWENRRTSLFFIGRIFFVPPRIDELYSLRLLLNVIEGPKSYENLKRINNHNLLTFRDACYALGLLDDDKEYMDAIKEASNWGMPSYLKQLFAILLLSNLMSRPEYV